MIGEVAGALVIFLTESGSVSQSEQCCKESKGSCKQASLMEVFSDDWAKVYHSIIKKYGWEGSGSAPENQQHLTEILTAELEQQKRQDMDGKAIWARIKSLIKKFIEKRLGEKLLNELCDVHAEYWESALESFISPASYIAADAISTAIHNFESGTRRIAPPAHKSLYFAEQYITTLLSCAGMEISEFVACSLEQVFPAHPPFDQSDVIVSSNGYVAGLSSLWEIRMRKREALAFRIVRGVLKRDRITYTSIREDRASRHDNGIQEEGLDYLKIFQGEKYLGTIPQCEEENLELVTLISPQENRLHMKPHLTLREEFVQHVSWIESTYELVFDRHFADDFGYKVSQEKELALRHKSDLSLVHWQSCYVWGNSDDKTILKTFGNTELRFFAAGILHAQREIGVREKCFSLIVYHSGHLLRALLAGEDTSGPWAVIC